MATDIQNPQPPLAPEPPKSHWPAVLVVLLILLLAGGGFYVFRYLQPKPEPQPVPPPQSQLPPPTTPVPVPPTVPEAEPTAKSPDMVTDEFYRWYAAYTGNAIQDGSLNSRPELDPSLIQKAMAHTEAADFFLCSATKPERLTTEPPMVSGNTASVTVNSYFNGYVAPVKVNLRLMDNVWKMVAVTCLSQDSALSTLENLKTSLNLDYLTVEDAVFTWLFPDGKSMGRETVKGKGLRATNATLDPTALNAFFANNGFTPSPENPNGRIKDNLACLLSATQNASGRYDVEVKCGEMK